MEKRKTYTICIPVDSSNPDIKVVTFRHDGFVKHVPVGRPVKVPDWVIDRNPLYAQYKI